ncbi:MAG: hypothetical protein ACI39F_07665 [Acutalibacteraceae bacterium]
MKITRWQMFVAWLKEHITLNRFLILVFFISIFHSCNYITLDIIIFLIQVLLAIGFINFSVKHRFSILKSKRLITAFIISIVFYIAALETFNIIYGEIGTINLFVLLIVLIFAGAVVYFDYIIPKND